MLASRNQMNVMSRGFGSTQNGSLEAYGAAGEMSTYLNGARHTSLRRLGAAHSGAKPNFLPKTQGQVMHSQEISTELGWAVVYVVKNRTGHYVVEHYCPKANSYRTDGKYPTIDEAMEIANSIAHQLKKSGTVKGINGLNGYSALGESSSPFTRDTTLYAVGGVLLWAGADAPGARPFIRWAGKILGEPAGPAKMVVFGLGLVTMVGAILTTNSEGDGV